MTFEQIIGELYVQLRNAIERIRELEAQLEQKEEPDGVPADV